jgi:hypothetical protein
MHLGEAELVTLEVEVVTLLAHAPLPGATVQPTYPLVQNAAARTEQARFILEQDNSKTMPGGVIESSATAAVDLRKVDESTAPAALRAQKPRPQSTKMRKFR